MGLISRSITVWHFITCLCVFVSVPSREYRLQEGRASVHLGHPRDLQHWSRGRSGPRGAQETQLSSPALRGPRLVSPEPRDPCPSAQPSCGAHPLRPAPGSGAVLPPAGHTDSRAPAARAGSCGWTLRLRSTAHLRGHPRRSAAPRPAVTEPAPARFRRPAAQPLGPPRRYEMPRVLV